MLFTWLNRRRRRKILAEPFPAAWQAILHEQVGHYAVLSDADRQKLRDAVQIMIAEREWEGCRGLELTDPIRVTIAALAAILILGLDEFYFDNVDTILVYPDEYVARAEHPIGSGLAIEEDSERLGEAQAARPDPARLEQNRRIRPPPRRRGKPRLPRIRPPARHAQRRLRRHARSPQPRIGRALGEDHGRRISPAAKRRAARAKGRCSIPTAPPTRPNSSR